MTWHHAAAGIGRYARASAVTEVWQRAGVDGINVMNWRLPGSYELFIDEVLPVLRKRGLAQTEYQPGTLRQKLFGSGSSERAPSGRAIPWILYS